MPTVASSSAVSGLLAPGPGLFRFQFGVQGQGFGQGYWVPGSDPMEGQDLDNFLQQYIAGITGIDQTLVRPRWQENPPNLPAYGTNWVAMGVVQTDPDPGFNHIHHDSDHDGRDQVTEHEIITVLCSFYGPRAAYYDRLLRTGLGVPQNHELMQLVSMGFVDTGPAIRAPELLKQQWTERIDRRIRFHRQVMLIYPVLNILSVSYNAEVEGTDENFHNRHGTVNIAG